MSLKKSAQNTGKKISEYFSSLCNKNRGKKKKKKKTTKQMLKNPACKSLNQP